MPARLLVTLELALILLGSIRTASADGLCRALDNIVEDTQRRNCWPEPFVAPDRAAVAAPMAIQIANGWRRQNLLGDFYFEPASGHLTEAGRLKVRWILLTGPQQHRLIYVHAAEDDDETAARLAAVQQLAAKIAPNNLPPIQATSISDDGRPADDVELIRRKFREKAVPTLDLPGYPHGGDAQNTNSSSGGS
ncbi:MAG: hypothetical protein ABFC77_08135 [Thermoguttaceae bacterium]